MLHTLAQAAVTVTETVTNTPPSTVPVEIVKQPPTGWEAKDTANLAISLIAALIAGFAVLLTWRNWRRDGPFVKTSFYLNGNTPENSTLGFNLRNIGRSPGLVDLLVVFNKTTGRRWLVTTEKFPLPDELGGDYELVELHPGDVFGATLSFNELENFRKEEWFSGIKIFTSTQEAESYKDLRFETAVGNEKVSSKIPRDIVKKLDAMIQENET